MTAVHLGLTGGIASGKSIVSDRFAELGAVIVDSDVIARHVVEPGSEGLALIQTRFGDDVIEDGRLDRATLGRIVFGDAAALADLNAIVHPLVRRESARLVEAAPRDAVVVSVIPLLIETGQAGDFDLLVVVDVPVEVQIGRLMARNGFSEAEAWLRVRAQASREERLRAADVVIDNSGELSATLKQVDDLWVRVT